MNRSVLMNFFFFFFFFSLAKNSPLYSSGFSCAVSKFWSIRTLLDRTQLVYIYEIFGQQNISDIRARIIAY